MNKLFIGLTALVLTGCASNMYNKVHEFVGPDGVKIRMTEISSENLFRNGSNYSLLEHCWVTKQTVWNIGSDEPVEKCEVLRMDHSVNAPIAPSFIHGAAMAGSAALIADGIGSDTNTTVNSQNTASSNAGASAVSKSKSNSFSNSKAVSKKKH